MYIVYLGSKRHSAWLSIEEARKVKSKLIEKGNADVSIKFDHVMKAENGYLFI